MPIETEIQPFLTWFLSSWRSGLPHWLVVVGTLLIGGVLIGWLFAALRRGPVDAVGRTARALAAGAVDLVRISPRRVWALGWLSVKESIRRRYLLIGLILLALILLFAGWFEPWEVREPARRQIERVFWRTELIVLVLTLFLSTLSLPAEIKNQTLHTVVTKPVRPSEIVLGRMLGVTAIGTFLLLIMGVCFYASTDRMLAHRHTLTSGDLQAQQAGDDQSPIPTRRTSAARGHWHQAFVDASGKGWLEPEQGHSHVLTIKKAGDKTTYRLGPPVGQLVARVAIRGKLRFLDRNGNPAQKGINVGDEWTYRTYIDGGTQAAAIWTFDGITKERFPASRPEFAKGLPLDLTIEVFRTYKGKTDDPAGIPGIVGSLAVRNPKTGLKVDARIFEFNKEFSIDEQYIPYKLQTAEGNTLDLFEDLIADGKLEVWLRCEEPGQYFGAAAPDVYFRARRASFTLNFVKGFVGIWLQMVVVIGLGVMFSTFLSGPIALVATAWVVVAGLVKGFIFRLATGLIPGGGPLEAFIRLITHQNVTSEMEEGLETTWIKIVDGVMIFMLRLVTAVIPSFGRSNFSDFVAYGYDISANMVLQSACGTMAYLLPVFVFSYFFFKLREIAK